MTPKEYLKQAYRLDHRINSDLAELGRLREMSTSISSPSLGEKVQTNRNTDAPFVKCLERIYALEEKINEEIDLLVNLKEEIRSVIDMVSNTDERMAWTGTWSCDITGKFIKNIKTPEMSTFVLKCPCV